MNRSIRLQQICIALLLSVSCLYWNSVTAAPATKHTSATKRALIIGIFPRRNFSDTMKSFTPLAEYLSSRLGRAVKLETSNEFATFWEQVEKGRYDLVHYNQYEYVMTHKKPGYEVIAKNEEFGESTIAGSLIVRNDSGIHSIHDLKGKKILFGGGPMAMQSYITATWLLHKGGLHKGDYIEEFAKNPPNAILAVYFKQAAAAGSGDKVLQLPIVTQNIDSSKLTYLARGKQLAHLPWAVNKHVSVALRLRLKELLTTLKDNPEGRKVLKAAKLTNLVPADDHDYDPHRKIIREVLGKHF